MSRDLDLALDALQAATEHMRIAMPLPRVLTRLQFQRLLYVDGRIREITNGAEVVPDRW